jgi:death-on-curing protein
MDEAIFLTLEEVLQIHLDEIDRHGGDPGVLNLGLLESAIAQPYAKFGGQYLHEGLAAMAAAYAFHVASNHAFADGNKRTALAAALVFLGMNDHPVTPTADAAESLILGIAKGETTKEQAATSFGNLLLAAYGAE